MNYDCNIMTRNRQEMMRNVLSIIPCPGQIGKKKFPAGKIFTLYPGNVI